MSKPKYKVRIEGDSQQPYNGSSAANAWKSFRYCKRNYPDKVVRLTLNGEQIARHPILK